MRLEARVCSTPGLCLRGRLQAFRQGEPPPPPVGGWGRGQQKVCVPEIGLKFPALLINFIFCLRKIFLTWVGGGAGRTGLARAPNNPSGGEGFEPGSGKKSELVGLRRQSPAGIRTNARLVSVRVFYHSTNDCFFLQQIVPHWL